MHWRAQTTEEDTMGEAALKHAEETWVYAFGGGTADGDASMKNLLGGKGANLAEMAKLGLPVPPGFTISTAVCTAYYELEREYPSTLAPQVDQALADLEKKSGKGFGDPENPLLVSVRSGARASMPGMMDTVLNLGLNDETVEGPGAQPAMRALPTTATAASSRCIRRRAGRRPSRFRGHPGDSQGRQGIELDTDLAPTTGSEIIGATRRWSRRDSASRSRRTSEEQLWGAIGAVFGPG